MICRIIREKTPQKEVRRYHTNVTISKKTYNRINRIPGVVNLSLSSGYEIYVEIGKAFDWIINCIDQKIILILQDNFVSKEKLDSDEEMECIIEDIEDFDSSLGEPTLIAFCTLSNSLKFLGKHKKGQDKD